MPVAAACEGAYAEQRADEVRLADNWAVIGKVVPAEDEVARFEHAIRQVLHRVQRSIRHENRTTGAHATSSRANDLWALWDDPPQ